MPNTTIITPEGGRLCRRALREGSALVGLMHLPAEFVPVEGVAYAIQETRGRLRIDSTPQSIPLSEQMQSSGVGDLLHRSIWNKTESPDVMTVRFIAAQPDKNVWTVYGPSHHQLQENHPSHAWVDIQADGSLTAIEAPFDAMGNSISQILTNNAVWPDRHGNLLALSQTHTPWRAHYFKYHELLVQAARDPSVADTLEATIAKTPIFRELSIGRVERKYCEFLSKLQDRGLMVIDTVRTADEHARHERACFEIMAEMVADPAPRKPARPL